MKIKLFLFIIFLTPIICGTFGILHDQVTYSISPEYFTKFKFIQFRLVDENMHMHMSDRAGAIIVGFMATWWVGIPIGLFYAATLMFFKNTENLYKIYYKTVAITFSITIIFSIIGYCIGLINENNHHIPNWYYPENLKDVYSFIIVGNIHNFSYLGGAFGLMTGTLYLVILKGKEKNSNRNFNIPK